MSLACTIRCSFPTHQIYINMITNPFDDEYHGLLRKILATGSAQDDRTGTGTVEVFAEPLKFNLADGTVPAMTSKKLAVKTVLKELLWLISGNTNVRPLIEKNVRIWTKWPCRAWLRRIGQPLPTTDEGWEDASKIFEDKIVNVSGFSDQY